MRNAINIDSAIMEPIKYFLLDPTIKFELASNECGEYDIRIDKDFFTVKPEEMPHTLRIVMDYRESRREARINAALYDFSYTMLEFEANRKKKQDAILEQRIALKMY